MVAERGTRPPPDVDAPMPQMAEHLLEVPKIVSQDRILQQTVEQFVNRSEPKRADLAKAEKSLAALMVSPDCGQKQLHPSRLGSRDLREGLRRGVEGVD